VAKGGFVCEAVPIPGKIFAALMAASMRASLMKGFAKTARSLNGEKGFRSSGDFFDRLLLRLRRFFFLFLDESEDELDDEDDRRLLLFDALSRSEDFVSSLFPRSKGWGLED